MGTYPVFQWKSRREEVEEEDLEREERSHA
jgi:hypothetical protein